MSSWPVLWEDLIVIMQPTKTSFWEQGSQRRWPASNYLYKEEAQQKTPFTKSKNFRFKIKIRICCCMYFLFYTYTSVLLPWNFETFLLKVKYPMLHKIPLFFYDSFWSIPAVFQILKLLFTQIHWVIQRKRQANYLALSRQNHLLHKL